MAKPNKYDQEVHRIGPYGRVWCHDLVAPDEVVFESGVYLLRKATAEALQAGEPPQPEPTPFSPPNPEPVP